MLITVATVEYYTRVLLSFTSPFRMASNTSKSSNRTWVKHDHERLLPESDIATKEAVSVVPVTEHNML